MKSYGVALSVLGGLAVTTLPRASRSFNSALTVLCQDQDETAMSYLLDVLRVMLRKFFQLGHSLLCRRFELF